MKTLLLTLGALSVAFAPLSARAQEPSGLSFDATEWSFGDIREEAGPVSHTFRFTNSGDTPIALDRVVASCGCTTPEYPRTPIAPGGKGSIVVTFDPQGMPGDFSKSIAVVSGGGRSRDFLIVKGHVTPRPMSIEEQFPHDAGGGLRIDNDMLPFRLIPQGGSSAMVISYINNSSKPVALSFEAEEKSGLLDVFAPETICAGCRGNITFTYDLSAKTAWGPQHDVTRLIIDGTPSSKTIYTAMTGIDDFSGADIASAPSLVLDASYHDFGEVRRRTVPYTFRLTAMNEGESELHIRSVSQAAGLQSSLREGMTIPAGGSLLFEVMFYSGRYSHGAVRESLSVVVDDPVRPTREIRISAIVK
jgi:hypothetical protein